jgi:hypothetical protein
MRRLWPVCWFSARWVGQILRGIRFGVIDRQGNSAPPKLVTPEISCTCSQRGLLGERMLLSGNPRASMHDIRAYDPRHTDFPLNIKDIHANYACLNAGTEPYKPNLEYRDRDRDNLYMSGNFRKTSMTHNKKVRYKGCHLQQSGSSSSHSTTSGRTVTASTLLSPKPAEPRPFTPLTSTRCGNFATSEPPLF